MRDFLNKMNILILGATGSGKGTQAKLLVKKFGFQYFESGDILREKAKEKSPLGEEVKRVMKEGVFVPNKIMAEVFADWLNKTRINKGIIFDGYPRVIDQYRDLQQMLSEKKLEVDRVIYLRLSPEEVMRRIMARRICPKCDIEYNLVTKPPNQGELCDKCQNKLIQREDDTEKSVQKRLSFQWPQIKELIDFVRQQGILIEVDGERSIETIHQEILARLEK